jgi:GT2 family glycosyltransferase
MKECDLSVIVPTHNRRNFLPGLLASLAVQTYPADRWELILVDDGSSDGTREYLELGNGGRPIRMTCLFQPQQGAAAARNAGARKAVGRGLLFLDDDMIAAPQLVAEHARYHRGAPDVVVIGHLSVPAAGREPWSAWEDAQVAQHYATLDSGKILPGPRAFFSGNCSVSTPLFNSVLGYNTRLKRTEDVELGYRLQGAGARFHYAATADSLHLGQHAFDKWLRHARIYGESDVSLGWEHGHEELQTGVFQWFRERNPLIQRLVRLCRAWPTLETPLIQLMDRVGRVAYRLHARAVSNAAYSAIYNLAYWSALSDALGRDRFWREVDRPSLPFTPPAHLSVAVVTPREQRPEA